jgi:DNA polymerase III epsilon subunit-like protein
MILFLDLETNGLPQMQSFDKFYNFTDINKYSNSRIVGLQILLCKLNNLNDVKEHQNFIVKPDGFVIENYQYHNISTEIAMKYGIPFKNIIKQYFEGDNDILKHVKYIIAHNADFDMNIFKSELFRYQFSNVLDSLDKTTIICSMTSTKELIKLVGATGKTKRPSLKELHKYATGYELPSDKSVLHLRDAVGGLIAKNDWKLE